MTAPTGSPPDPQARFALEIARSRQNLGLAALAGAATAAAAAAAWAAITAAAGVQSGLMAIGVGIAVGLVVRATGHGVDVPFRVLGATLALSGCVAGNLLAGCVFLAGAHQVGVVRVLEVLDWTLAVQLMQAMFSPIDVAFYGFAAWEGWRLAVRAPAAAASATPAA
jgi:hypothetical protein